MKKAAQSMLSVLALEELRKTRDRGWDYLCGSDCISLCYCSWEEVEEFSGETHFNLPWSEEREYLIARGEAEPNQKELRQWRIAKAACYADLGQAGIAWIKRISSEDHTGFALFTGRADRAPEDEPGLEGIFDSPEKALRHLQKLGHVSETNGINWYRAWKETHQV